MNCNVLEYLEKSAKQYPQKIAFADDKEGITYENALNTAKSIGSFLGATSVRNRPAIIFMKKTCCNLPAMFGTVYSGNFYVPVDVSVPQKRVESIIETLKPFIIITDQANFEKISKFEHSCDIVKYEDIKDTEINHLILEDIRRTAISTDPVYGIFTSGSTGVPKGVCVCHRSIIDLVEQFAETFSFSSKDIFGNQAPFDFDVSVKDIYSTIKNGASMIIIPKMFFSFPKKLVDFLVERKVSVIIWAVSALRIVSTLKALPENAPLSLNRIMFSGEVMPIESLEYWQNHVPKAKYVNLYGPTEITCNCTYYEVDKPAAEYKKLPIGKPFKNTDIILLNEKNERCAVNEKGEICVRGVCLALGYYNAPEPTAKAFCQNPLNTAYPELIYRTGDIGYTDESENIVFAGRQDSQIKHMGHRIELGEIEIAANAVPYIDVSRCIYDKENEQIVLFYQSNEECRKALTSDLRKAMPQYMLPNKFVWYEKFPMSKNMKIDIAKIKEEYFNGEN